MRDIFNPQTRWCKKMDTSRRRLLAGVGGLSLGAAASAVQPRQATANETSSVAGSEGGEELVAVAVNDALEGAYGRHNLLCAAADGRTPSEMRAPWLRHDARNQFIELFVEFSGCLHQRRIVAYDH